MVKLGDKKYVKNILPSCAHLASFVLIMALYKVLFSGWWFVNMQINAYLTIHDSYGSSHIDPCPGLPDIASPHYMAKHIASTHLKATFL